jgi:site-specific DNA-methyltransferase (adenine-specific)
MTERFNLFEGNCLEVMATMAENSIDSIVTDPPYELGFMGKSWDSSGVAFNIEVWQEALRVLKPGGHLLAFSGSRTYHRMAVAIEDAGFEIRDQIMWIYGSGFPKSHNLSKGIDKAAGAKREVVGLRKVTDSDLGQKSGWNDLDTSSGVYEYTSSSTPAAKQWDGWGTALKPAHEPIVVARKPLIGTVANNVLTFGTGGLNIDGARVKFESEADRLSATPQGKVTVNNVGNMPDVENDGRKELARPDNSAGRWPANVIHDGSDEVVELFPDSKGGAYPAKRGQAINTAFASGQETEGGFRAMGDSGSAARFFYCAKASKKDRNEGLDGFEEVQLTGGGGLTAELREDGSLETASAGGKYGSIKAKKANHHPTVKPTTLMQYLVRLVTPPNGIVLDPFLGSGSTGKAAMYEGFNFIGIELTPEYLPIAKARIEFALASKELELDFDTP